MTALVLVTGASGVLGQKVLSALSERGWRTRALVHRRPVASADERVTGDIENSSTLRAAVSGIDAIVHLAAVTHARNPRRYERANVDGTRNLVDAARAGGTGRFLYVSSRAVDESGGAYSRSKAAAERIVQVSGLDATIVRLPEVYGAGSREGLDRMIASARAGRPIPVVGSGSEVVYPVHVDDAVAALVAALPRGVASGKTYTLAAEPISLADFARACALEAGSGSRVVHIPSRVIGLLAFVSRFAPLPLYPDQLARLRAPKPPASEEAARELGFRPRPLTLGELVRRGQRSAASR